jgi:hypothetical protein
VNKTDHFGLTTDVITIGSFFGAMAAAGSRGATTGSEGGPLGALALGGAAAILVSGGLALKELSKAVDASNNLSEIEAASEEVAKAIARKLAERIALCEATHQAYDKLDCKSCKDCTPCDEAVVNLACWTSKLTLRGKYLSMKCDYVLAGSLIRGSSLAEAGHIQALAEQSSAASKCGKRVATCLGAIP